MGGGTYSSTSSVARSTRYRKKSRAEIFTQQEINNAMNPYGIDARESCDSDEHPESVAIIIALDVTGSMGNIPESLVKGGLHKVMGRIIQAGVQDPQILFLGIGDHECDRSPLQVGQFESSDDLLDKWLTDVYLEGGGGGNMGESYPLAWMFAANHTSIDCFKKRNQKGLLFTIGDEPALQYIPATAQKSIMGTQQASDMAATELLEKAKETYDVYHIHVLETHSGSRKDRVNHWEELIGKESLKLAETHEQIPDIITRTIINSLGKRPKDPIKEPENISSSKDDLDNVVL